MKLFVALVLTLAVANSALGANLDTIIKPGFPEGRIINGVEAQPGEAPFIVSLQTSAHFCAGSIIDKHWVLTAAHCLVYSQYSVVAGAHNRIDFSNVQVRKVSAAKHIAHEEFNGSVGPNDIGLIHIAEAFDLNALARDDSAPVSKIALPSGKFAQLGNGKLFGWGRDNSGALPTNLQTLDVEIIGYEACKAALPSNSELATVNICTYSTGKADGACNGDSGGPLVISTKNGYELVGIVSWGYTPCASMQYPSVYTWTTAYEKWISEQVNNFTSA